MLQSPRLKYHLQKIGIDQSLSSNTIYEHKCLETIKKVNIQAGKCGDQHQFKYILEYSMVSTPELFTDDSPISPMTSTPVNKPCPKTSLCLSTKILDVKKKTATCRVGYDKSKRKAIKFGTALWALKQKRKGDSKIDEQIKQSLYN